MKTAKKIKILKKRRLELAQNMLNLVIKQTSKPSEKFPQVLIFAGKNLKLLLLATKLTKEIKALEKNSQKI